MAEDDRPHVSGRLGALAAVIIFIGFNLTFFPQFVLGYLGMPRRYHVYPPEFQVLNVMSSAGASILGVGYLLPLVYLIWSLRYGAGRGGESLEAEGSEWQTPSPPPTDNFEVFRPCHVKRLCLSRSGVAAVYTAGRPPMSDSASFTPHQFDDAEQQHEASWLGMWVFLPTEVMFFGGMFLGYTIYRSTYPEAFADASNHLDIWLGTINTAVLIGSSFTMALAVRSAQPARAKPLVLVPNLDSRVRAGVSRYQIHGVLRQNRGASRAGQQF